MTRARESRRIQENTKTANITYLALEGHLSCGNARGHEAAVRPRCQVQPTSARMVPRKAVRPEVVASGEFHSGVSVALASVGSHSERLRAVVAFCLVVTPDLPQRFGQQHTLHDTLLAWPSPLLTRLLGTSHEVEERALTVALLVAHGAPPQCQICAGVPERCRAQ